ncbi:glycosyltransferase family 4 protein [Sphingomonas sp. PB2P12]
MKRVLFVTWDGPQVSYVEGLFVPIFKALGGRGFHFDIVQFRWGSDDTAEPLKRLCAEAGIGLRLHNVLRRGGSLGAMATAVVGARAVRSAAAAFGSDVIMPRSLMPALAILAGRRWTQPIIFDADGLPADERVEFAGLDANGAPYRLLREIEASMVRKADITLARTDAARDILLARAGPMVSPARVRIVTNGRDETLFAPIAHAERVRIRTELGVATDAPLIVYAGSVGPQYRLEESVRLLAAVRRRLPDAKLLILTGSPDLVPDALAAVPHSPHHVIVRRVPPDAVSAYLACADVATAYRNTGFSMRAVAPVKVAEYLLCGTPVVGTAAIGDVRSAVAAGVFMDENAGHDAAAKWLEERLMAADAEDFRRRARAIGLAHFSLDRAVGDYATALEAI